MNGYIVNKDGTVESIGDKDEFKEDKPREVTKVLKRKKRF